MGWGMLSTMADNGASLEADVAIVGSGPAGLALAIGLEQAGLRSLVLEGGRDPYASRWNLSMNALKAADYGMGKPYLDLHVQRALGGGINVWGGWCAPLRDANLTVDQSKAYAGWPLTRDELRPHYIRAHGLLEIGGAPEAVLEPPTELTSAPALAVYGFGLSPVRGMPKHWLQRLEASTSIDVRTGATVLDINASGGRIESLGGIDELGRPFTARARRYVLAGGSCLNALLLEKNAARLPADEKRAALIGQHLADHPYIYGRSRLMLRPEVEDEIERSSRWFGGFLSICPASATLKQMPCRDFHVLLTRVDEKLWTETEQAAAANHAQVFGRKPQLYSTIIGMEAAAGASSHLRLDRSDSNLAGAVDIHIPEKQAEHGGLAVEWLKRHAVAAWFDKAKPDDIVAVGHLMGTTRMETDGNPGVVDRDCRVIGTSNLFVAGSSVFPTTGFANPTFTIAALALRLAQHLGETRHAP